MRQRKTYDHVELSHIVEVAPHRTSMPPIATRRMSPARDAAAAAGTWGDTAVKDVTRIEIAR